MLSRLISRLLSTLVLAAAVRQFAYTAQVKGQASSTGRIEAVRFWSFENVTRVAVQTRGDYKVVSDQVERPSRVYFDLAGLQPPMSARRGAQTIHVGDQRVQQIRIAEASPGKTRLVLDLEGPAEVISSQLVNPDRLIIEIRPKDTSPPALMAKTKMPSAPTESTGKPHLSTGQHAITVQTSDGFVVRQAPAAQKTIVAATPTPSEIRRAPDPVEPAPAVPISVPASEPATTAGNKAVGVAAPAKKDSAGDRSLVRVFGLKLGKVVIDAGHGGHDTGTIGPNGLLEKDLVLDVALRLGTLITQQLGAQVIYTRSDDTFIPLEQRTKIANTEKADLFISIHANSSPEPGATGVETYFFNLTSDKTGLDLATRENATATSSISDLNDLLHRAVLQAKMEESREFAQNVQASLWAGSVKMNNRSRDRGVRQAPFVVLIGATMPSILAEIGFVSNPHDEKLLRQGDQRQKIAEALFRGVSQYARTLSHVQMAKSGSE